MDFSVNKLINSLEETLIALLLTAMTLLTFFQVILRYCFDTGLVWSLEATSYFFAWLVLISMSYGIRRKSHITVELFQNRLQPGLRRITALIAMSICLFYAGLMAYGGIQFIQRLLILGHEARDIPVERWILTLLLPIGFILLIVRLTQLLYKIWTGVENSIGIAESKSTDSISHIEGS